MKKLMLILILMISFNACTIESDIGFYSVSFTVYTDDRIQPNHWWPVYDRYTGDLLYYYCEFQEPRLTLDVIENRSIEAYLCYRLENNDVFIPLPFSYFFVNDKEYKWEEQVTVAYDPGYITFILKIDDLADELPYYDSYDFLVKFMR